MLVGLGAAVMARLVALWSLPLPTCGFRRLVGAPCPLCGGARALRAAAEFDFPAAIQLNPLVMLAGALVLCWWCLDCLDRFGFRPLVPRIEQRLRGRPVRWIALVLVLLNWAYLIRYLP